MGAAWETQFIPTKKPSCQNKIFFLKFEILSTHLPFTCKQMFIKTQTQNLTTSAQWWLHWKSFDRKKNVSYSEKEDLIGVRF